MALDLVIKNGTVVDGSGGPRYRADVGVKGARIVEIGRISAPAERTVDADGLIVAPGFIDGHTHMDAQVAWDPLGSCSCWHGVTTVVMGNCGFALAPCKPADREWFARCLTAVEDIPTEDDLKAMAHAVEEAVRCGAIGFSTSRATTHVTPDGTPVASRIADWHEIDVLVGAMGRLDAGIFQIGPDISGGAAQRVFLDRMRKVALETGRPVMFGMLATKQGLDPNPWDYQLRWMDETVALGGRAWGQATTRSINAVFSLKSYLPFDLLPEWQEIRALPLAEQKARLRDPEVRRRLIAAEARMKPKGTELQGGGAATTDPKKPDYDNLFPMLDIDWDDPSVGELSRRQNRHPVEVIIDLCLEDDNRVLVQPLVNESPADVLGLLKHPRTLATFSDSGAHVCQEMGSSLQTHLLSYWVRKRQQFTLEQAVRMLTFDNASAWELPDRGLVRTGYIADFVVFDADRIRPRLPTVEQDLPGGARRLVQKADGIAATVVNGAVALEHGDWTGATAGRVLKGRLAA